MTWVAIGDMLLDIDKPARSVDIKAIYNNTEAMCNGDAGAPKIQAAALDPSIGLLVAPTTGTSVLVYQNPVDKISYNPVTGAIGVVNTLQVGGAATITATINTEKTGAGTIDTEAHLEVYKTAGINGHAVKTILHTQVIGATEVNLPFSYNATGLIAYDKIYFEVFGGSSGSDPDLVKITATDASLKSGAAQNSVWL